MLTFFELVYKLHGCFLRSLLKAKHSLDCVVNWIYHSYGNRTERFQIICWIFCHRDLYKSKSPDPSGVIVKSKGITEGFPRERRHVVKSAQCVTERVAASVRLTAPGCPAEERKDLNHSCRRAKWILTGLRRGPGDVLRQPLYTGNGLTTTIKIWKAQRSSAPTFQAVTGWKSLSHVQRHPKKKESVASHVFTYDFIEVSGGWNT